MIKRRIISTVAAFVCVLSVFAANSHLASAYEAPRADDSGIVAHFEETVWRYRINNGVLEKRLWSLTYERWLTGWMPANS